MTMTTMMMMMMALAELKNRKIFDDDSGYKKTGKRMNGKSKKTNTKYCMCDKPSLQSKQ